MRRLGIRAMAVMKEIPKSMSYISSGDQKRSELEACQSDGGECQRAGQLDEVRAWPTVPCGEADVGSTNQGQQERSPLLSQRFRKRNKHRNRDHGKEQAGPVRMRLRLDEERKGGRLQQRRRACSTRKRRISVRRDARTMGRLRLVIGISSSTVGTVSDLTLGYILYPN